MIVCLVIYVTCLFIVYVMIVVVGKLGSRAQTLKCVRIKKMKCTHKNNLV